MIGHRIYNSIISDFKPISVSFFFYFILSDKSFIVRHVPYLTSYRIPDFLRSNQITVSLQQSRWAAGLIPLYEIKGHHSNQISDHLATIIVFRWPVLSTLL